MAVNKLKDKVSHTADTPWSVFNAMFDNELTANVSAECVCLHMVGFIFMQECEFLCVCVLSTALKLFLKPI